MNGNNEHKLSRRDLLEAGIKGCAACMILPMFAGKFEGMEFEEEPKEDYYALNKNKYKKMFEESAMGFEQYITSDVGADKAKQIREQSEAYFDRLYAKLPAVGGSKNINVVYLIEAASYLAFYPSMQQAGKTARDLGKIFFDMYEQQIEKDTPEERKKVQDEFFSDKYKKHFKQYAAWTQKNKYPMNWIAEYKEGNGTDFDWGYDYKRCGIVEFLKSENASELAPYICLTDFVKSWVYGTGLERESTIANGNSICDFRYKRGRKVEKVWENELYET
ncbi:MAG: L-2-amino-thiazoline-4-carboxylic acid hydrolase [Firmicutes bacterium]|nr:L-2-amino-thiazoline-4-carboxylic acid hydrolase [Bacillota bacterium]